MKDTEFDKIIDRYLKGQPEEGEKEKVEDWLDRLTAEKAFPGELTSEEQSVTGEKIYAGLLEKIEGTIQPASHSIIIKLRPLLKIASCITLFGLLMFSFRVKLKAFFNIGQYAAVTNSKGHITKSILSDGSIVWLKGNSRLSYPVSFTGDTRVVKLQGEALFEVAKDAAHPFIIHCGTLTTKVLGTSFNIKQNPGKTEVTVLTGKVFLSSKNTGAVTLHPYQKGLYYDQKKTLVKEVQAAIQVDDLTKGTEYAMLFNDTPLAEVLKRIDKKFEVEIDSEGQQLNSRLITADCTDQSLNNTMQMISEALNLNYEINGKQILLKKKHQ
jgi:transmembrane sensor